MFSRTAAEADRGIKRVVNVVKIETTGQFALLIKLLTCIEVDDGLLLVGIVGKVDVGRLGVLVDGIVDLEDGMHSHDSAVLQQSKRA